MKKYIFFLIFVSIFSGGNAKPLQVTVGAEAAILMNADTGAILFEKQPYDLHYPASTTKIATALYVLHHKKDLNAMVKASQEALATVTQEAKRKSGYKIPSYWQEPDGTHIGLKKDEELSVLDLLKGLMICSGNDASNVLAEHAEGTVPQFIEKLNPFLKELGCKNTNYTNPHGLHDPQHQTTAYDLAIMTKEALKDPIFREIVSQTRFLRPKTNKQKAVTLLQSNRLLRQGKYYYPKAIGVKTGNHSKAKKTFVGAAKSNDRTLIVVLLKNQDRDMMFKDAIKLFDAAFNQPKVHHVLLKAGPQKFEKLLQKGNRKLQTSLSEDLSLDYYPAEDPKAKCLLYWGVLQLPIQKDQPVAELHLVSADGKMLKKATLLAAEGVGYSWPHNWIKAMVDHWVLVVVGVLFLLFILYRRLGRS